MQAETTTQRTAARSAAGAALDAPAAVNQQYLRFALGGDSSAVRIESVREILEMTQLTPLPLTPGFVRGVMNLRGAVVPVIDLAVRLGLEPATKTRHTRIVIVEVDGGDDDHAGNIAMGLLVDAVYEVFDASGADQHAAPRIGTRIPGDCIRYMVRRQGVAVPALDLDVVLASRVLADLITAHAMQ